MIKKYFTEEFSKSPNDIIPFHAYRVLAIVFTIGTHILDSYRNIIKNTYLINLDENMLFCMDLLFFVSAYFITLPLLKNDLNSREIKAFFFKRLIRIIPTFYISIIIYWYFVYQEFHKFSKIILETQAQEIILIYQILEQKLKYVWGDFLFISNYMPVRIVNIGWAVSAIFHFYVIIPFLVFIVKKFFNSYRVYIWVFLYILFTFIRFYHYYYEITLYKIYFMTHTRFDSFVMGILFAEFHVYYEKHQNKIQIPDYIRYFLSIFLITNLFLILLGDYWQIPVMRYFLRYNWFNLIVFLMGVYFFVFKNVKDHFIQFFSFPFYVPLSKISYSVFIFHEYIIVLINKNSSILFKSNMNDLKIVSNALMAIFLSIIFGWIFYLLFEKPFLMIKSKSKATR